MCTPAIGSIPVAFKFSFSFSIFHSFSSSLLSSLSRVAFLLSPFLLLPVRRPESYFPAIFPAACNSPSPSELNQSFQFEAVAILYDSLITLLIFFFFLLFFLLCVCVCVWYLMWVWSWFGCTCSDIGAVERGKMASQSGASRRSISSSTRRASESGAPRKSISSSRPLYVLLIIHFLSIFDSLLLIFAAVIIESLIWFLNLFFLNSQSLFDWIFKNQNPFIF